MFQPVSLDSSDKETSDSGGPAWAEVTFELSHKTNRHPAKLPGWWEVLAEAGES